MFKLTIKLVVLECECRKSRRLLSTLLFGDRPVGQEGGGMFAERRNSSAMSELPRADRRAGSARICCPSR